MRTDRVTKMYDNLTNKERAALAFHYMTDMNETELARIEATVPRHAYRCVDLEYQSWLASFVHVACVWAIEYWQTKVRKVAATGAGLHLAGRGEYEKADAWFDESNVWDSRLTALDRALEAMCEEHGVDADSVRRLAGTNTLARLHDNTEPDAELQAHISRSFSQLLSEEPESIADRSKGTTPRS